MSGAAGLAAGALLLCLFALQSDARDFLEHYWQQQVLASVSGQRGSSVPGLSFLTVLKFTLETVAPSLVLIGIAAGMRWKERSRTVRSSYLRAALFLGAIGCAASFPLAVSQRLSAYYLAPSMVFYASGFGFLAAALWPWDPSRLALGDKAWLWTRNVLAAGVVIKVAWLAATWDRPGRDPTYLDLVRVAQQEGVWDEVVGGDPSLRQDWALYAYLMRYLRVSFECRVQPNLSYYIMGADPMQARPPGLVAVEGQCGSATYRLLRRIEPPAADSLSPDGSRQYSKKRDPRD
jgi:hypothetical protein